MRLKAIMAELHMFDGDINWERPVRLGLSIDGRDFLRVSVDRGESLLLDAEPLVEFDMGQYGTLVIRDFTDRLDATLCQGEIAAPRRILDSDRLIGLCSADLMKGCSSFGQMATNFTGVMKPDSKENGFPKGSSLPLAPACGRRALELGLNTDQARGSE